MIIYFFTALSEFYFEKGDQVLKERIVLMVLKERIFDWVLKELLCVLCNKQDINVLAF